MRFGLALLRCGSPRAFAASRAFAPLLALLAALIIAAAPIPAHADDDPPDRVGRVAEFAGQLYLSAQDRPDDWSPIGINYPVTTGDNLWVSGDGRAEVDYGGGQFRLAGDTSANVSRLDDRQLALFIARGRVIVRVRVQDAGEAVRIDTPNTQVALMRPGLYRVDVAAEGQVTTVVVREGESLIALASGTQQVFPGQAMTVSGMEPVAADVRRSPGIDGFDTWSANRDRRYEGGSATAYVSRQMVGYADLDEYGRWESDATYGPVWYPSSVAPDWAPYSDGYWTNVAAWGLTWVDAAPWGYAPSHYGRWVHVDQRWAWCPGAHKGRPHWAPALVGWYGGAGWGLTSKAGAPVYGWVPLSWGEAFQPWWRSCSQNCWNRYNRAYAVTASERPNVPHPRYAHMNVRGAMTTVPGDTLVGRKPVRPNVVSVPASQTASAPLLASAPSVAAGAPNIPVYRPGERGTPTPASVLYTHAKRNPGFGVATAAPAPMPSAAGAASAGSGSASSVAAPGAASKVRPAPSVAMPIVPPPNVPSATGTMRDVPQQARALPSVAAPVPTPAVSGTTAVAPQVPQRRPLPVAAPSTAANMLPATAFSGSLGTNGIALPAAPQATPHVVRTVPAQPIGQPAVPATVAIPATVVVPAPPGATAPDRQIPRPPADADAAKAGKATDRNAPVVPAAK